MGSQRALPGSDQPGSGARRDMMARDRAQEQTVCVKAVGVGEIALGEKQDRARIENWVTHFRELEISH